MMATFIIEFERKKLTNFFANKVPTRMTASIRQIKKFYRIINFLTKKKTDQTFFINRKNDQNGNPKNSLQFIVFLDSVNTCVLYILCISWFFKEKKKRTIFFINKIFDQCGNPNLKNCVKLIDFLDSLFSQY